MALFNVAFEIWNIYIFRIRLVFCLHTTAVNSLNEILKRMLNQTKSLTLRVFNFALRTEEKNERKKLRFKDS